ncbi:DUF4301 family protein [Zeaxanthinibacter enoshimensis]|uniref:Uncharacterized protein DUF4301 n=1 Tax=Zeaxanthinibacter enoshimensis TaxID=392009 RepID=A0A4R6TS74_9FLAO|nr:DUF4301 family protein [Zeaxanthinibacter enoshimensis]TDQ33177.1 uncharacterized protein DUF4301 [Zeaxanthinibacter enoshimensis]
MSTFTEKDQKQFKSRGISEQKVREQIEMFKEGIPFVQLEKAAVVDDGILKLTPGQESEYIHYFEENKKDKDLLKFVPASGAASRMFKTLFTFLSDFDPSEESLDDYFERTGDKAMKRFVDGITDFPFYTMIRSRIKGKVSSKDEEVYLFVAEMLEEDKLNYGFYPKGLLPFHNYRDYLATPFEEHLKEGAAYASKDNNASLHFTISEQHGDLFNNEFSAIKDRVSSQTQTSFNISYSYQKSSTDTIAVNMENEPFREADGSILFRPGGHGALIENLDEQDADLIFIKNIDNVVVPEQAGEVIRSKKLLAGLLLQVQEKAFEYAAMLDKGDLHGEQIQEIREFLENRLNVRFTDKFQGYSAAQQLEILKDKLDRPIRVCGMVKNEGEPGGGPFWIRDEHNNVSLQIIESAQVDTKNGKQLSLFRDATHFNPVDLVCSVKNHRGEKYHLTNYVNPRLAFITQKTKEGQKLKALELPGLWNGAMAFWNTIFVEVPLETFNPVKTVNDLLKPAHQVR